MRTWIAVNEVSPQVARQAAVLLAFDDTLKLAYQGQEFPSGKAVVEHYRWHELTFGFP